MSALWILAMSMSAANADVDARLQDAAALVARQESVAAAEIYRALLAQGVDGPQLRYNLGTLALEEGQIGEAVLQLRAARRRDPLDERVAYNLDTALASRADTLTQTDLSLSFAAIGERTPPRPVRVLLACCLAVLGVVLAAIGVVGRKRALGALVIIAAAASVLVAFMFAARLSFEAQREAVVLVNEAPARKAPDPAAAIVFDAHAGLLGDVIDEDGAFFLLRFENGVEAWIAQDALAEVP